MYNPSRRQHALSRIGGYLKKEGLVVPSNNARMLDAIDFTSGMIGNDDEVDGRAAGGSFWFWLCRGWFQGRNRVYFG